MLLVRKIRAGKLLPTIESEHASYGPEWLGIDEPPAAWQLRTWNNIWRDISQRVPRVRSMVSSNKWPGRFESWEQFRNTVPPTEKSDVRDHAPDFTDPLRPIDGYRISGGSTGEPIEMPKWTSELATTICDKYLGRSWYGVQPTDKLFTIWGHRHLLGKGMQAKINGFIRDVKDSLIGTRRFSAYDISEPSMQRAAASLLTHRPGYVVGYSSTIEAFARFNISNTSLRNAGVKTVIGTSEVFPTIEGPRIIADVFGCPASMEYGSVETDILAHTCPMLAGSDYHAVGGYRAFWRRYFLEVVPSSDGTQHELLVTSLFPRCFPLIRYRIGDTVKLYPGDPEFAITRMSGVAGLASSSLKLPDGTHMHTMGIKHCAEGLPTVSRYQLVQSSTNIEMRIILSGPGAPEHSGPNADSARSIMEQEVRRRLTKVNAQLTQVPITFTKPLIQTRAGKTPLIAKEP